MTLKKAKDGMSFWGVPLTVTFQLMSVVASGPTIKLPVAIDELMEQVGEVISRFPTITGEACTTQDVSNGENPVPLNVIVAPLGPLAGNKVSVAFTDVTLNVEWPESPVFPVRAIR